MTSTICSSLQVMVTSQNKKQMRSDRYFKWRSLLMTYHLLVTSQVTVTSFKWLSLLRSDDQMVEATDDWWTAVRNCVNSTFVEQQRSLVSAILFLCLQILDFWHDTTIASTLKGFDVFKIPNDVSYLQHCRYFID